MLEGYGDRSRRDTRIAHLRSVSRYLGVRPFGPGDESRLAALLRIVFPAGRPEGTVHRAGYVFCPLEQFYQGLLRRDHLRPGSSRWADPRASLLSGDAWLAVKGAVLNALHLPEDPEELLAERAGRLDEQLRDVADRLQPGVDVGSTRRRFPGDEHASRRARIPLVEVVCRLTATIKLQLLLANVHRRRWADQEACTKEHL